MDGELGSREGELRSALDKLRCLLDQIKDENIEDDERIELIEEALVQVERCHDLLGE